MVVWLVLGGIALVEQLNIATETNSSDEQALAQLQLAVKSDTLNASIGAPFLNLLAFLIIAYLNIAVASVPSNLIDSFPISMHTRSFPRFTCCYRI